MITPGAVALAALLLMAAPARAEVPLAADQAAYIRTAIAEGRLVQAGAMLDRNREASIGGPEQALLEAELMLALRHHAAARRRFLSLTRGSPEDARAWTGLGLAALHLGHVEEASSALKRAVGLPAADWRSWNALGVAHDRAGRWEDSEGAYLSALQSSPHNAAIWNNRGYSLLLQKRPAEALAAFERAAVLRPSDARIRINREIARAMLGEYPVRREPKEKASHWAARLNNAGYAAWLAGNLPQARSLLTRAVTDSEIFYVRAANNLRLVEGEIGR